MVAPAAGGRGRRRARASSIWVCIGIGIGNGTAARLRYDGAVCGRYTLTVSAAVLAEVFAVDVPELRPRYNVAPTQTMGVVRLDRHGARAWRQARWGLIPSWSKDPAIGNRMINARAETAADKPSFRAAIRRRRCLVPADGFYEWRRSPDGKVPHLIRFEDGRPFGFAGLWERWRDPGGEEVDSYTILTTRPNEVVATLHDRMPVILPPAVHHEWLASGEIERDRLEVLLAPHPAAGMEAYPVSRHVNSPANDDPECVRPV